MRKWDSWANCRHCRSTAASHALLYAVQLLQ